LARAFSENERQLIQQNLMDAGREAFSTFGLKKTSVNELARAAGISKGSFYSFFDSKEEMYLQIIEAEESKLREQILTPIFNEKFLSKQSLKTFMLEGLRIMETNPLIRRMYEQDELEQVLRALPPERMTQHVQADEDWMGKLFAEWQKQGLIINADIKAVAGAIKLIIVSSLLKDALGGDGYPEAIELLVDLVASGLTTKEQGA